MYYSYATSKKAAPKAIVATKAAPTPKPPSAQNPVAGNIPLVLLVGGAVTAVLSFLYGSKYQVLFLGTGIASAALGGYLYISKIQFTNPFPGAWQWMQDYSIYLLPISLVGLYLFRGVHSTLFGILGQFILLGMTIVSAGSLLTNFSGIPALLPNLGADIRKTINPKSQ